MLIIDSAPIRQKARREYQKVQRDLEKAKAELERFRNEDQPQYAKWLNSHFGALLTENRALHEKLYAAQTFVSEVHQEFHFGSHRSIYGAYAAVIRRREHPEEFEQEMKEAEEAENEFRREFEETFGKSQEEFFEKFGFPPGSGPDRSRPRETLSSKPFFARLKELYRSLARRLHPDSGGPRSQQEIEWWHQTQTAYQAGDVEQLELILTLAEIKDKGAKDASVSILQQITNRFKESLKELKRELRQYRRDVAWNFSKADQQGPILHETRQMLEVEKMRLSILLQRFQSEIDAWKSASAQKRPRRTLRPRKSSNA